MFSLQRLVLIALAVTTMWLNCTAQVKTKEHGEASRVTLCDVLESPDSFLNKRISMRASYRYGFEWQELFCLGCTGKVWLELDKENISEDADQKLMKVPEEAGTLTAVFSGELKASNSREGYGYVFVLFDISEVEVVADSGWIPDKLSKEQQSKLCKSNNC